MDVLLTTGTLVGLMGHTMAAYARRMSDDLKVLRDDGADVQARLEDPETGKRWRRLEGDSRRIGFFAHRLIVLARSRAPRNRDNIDINECLAEVLDETDVDMSSALGRHFETLPEVRASKTELRLLLTVCVDYVLRALHDTDIDEREVEVRTSQGSDSVVISFVHNGEWPAPEQIHNQFVPFHGVSDNPKAALELPVAMYLARKYRGTVALDTRSDDRVELTIRLSVQAGKK